MLKTLKQILFILTMALTLEKELFEDYYPKASKILSKMSMREKVGQLFFPRYNKLTVEKELIEKNPGGYILFANNLENHTLEEIINELKLVQEKSKIKLGLGVDEEGGKVNRVSLYFREKPFPSPQNLYNEGGIEKILLIEKEKRDLLRKIGFNFNLAPVADISTNKSDYIYERSLGRNENETSDYIRREIEESNKDNKFTQCLKHFPGYGNNSDTHFNLVVDDRKYEIFEKKDFLPFISGIKSNVNMILISHNVVNCIDDKFPGSCSLKMYNLLRNKLNFSGLFVTDSISMGAIVQWEKINKISAVVLSVKAGCNVIITSEFERHYNEVLNAVLNGDIKIDVIEKAALKVIAWKLYSGIIN